MTDNRPDMKVLQSVVGGVEYGSGLGFGCMGITAFYGEPMDDERALELLKSVYDGGCRHFDSAEIYAQGDKYNETILGKFFQTVPRESFYIATKYWPTSPDEMYETKNVTANGDDVYEYDSVKNALSKSLERLQLPYVDLYYAHRVLSLEGGIKFANTCKRLLDEGLIKSVGLSEVNGKWLKVINEVCPIAAVQQEWSLMTRTLEDELVPVCKELNVAVVAYSPLSRNLLAKKVETPTDWRATLPRYRKENLGKNQAILDQIQGLATKYNCTAAQLALAWLFHKGAELGVRVIPIPGTTKIPNATTNMGSVSITISNDDSDVLESLADQVAGERYTERWMSVSMEGQK